jgi:hypothetical protein
MAESEYPLYVPHKCADKDAEEDPSHRRPSTPKVKSKTCSCEQQHNCPLDGERSDSLRKRRRIVAAGVEFESSKLRIGRGHIVVSIESSLLDCCRGLFTRTSIIAPTRPKRPRCGGDLVFRHDGKESASALEFFRFLVLDVYDVTGGRGHIDLADVV